MSNQFKSSQIKSSQAKSSHVDPAPVESLLKANEPVQKKPTRLLACPLCGKPASDDKRYYPFCCARCKQIDLGNWAKESYRIDAGPLMGPDDPENESDE